MDIFKQYLEVFQNWSDLQVNTGKDWLETVQGVDKFDPKLVWYKTLDAYQASLQGSLEAEKTGFQTWFEQVASVKELPKEATDLVKNVQGITEQVTGLQQEFVNAWFKALRQVDFLALPAEFLKAQPVPPAVKA